MNAPDASPDFTYRNGEMHAEDVPLSEIAKAVGTPVYVYSTAGLARQYQAYADAFADMPATVCFGVKANSNLAVIRTLASMGAGADIVSEGELRQALAAGVAPDKIVFSGVGKREGELAAALDAEIHQINVESVQELAALSRIAGARGVTARIAIRINPDVDARTHEKITTGKAENKFGVDLVNAVDAFRLARDLPGVEPVGIAVHIGSQLLELDPYRAAFEKVARLARALAREGIPISRIDLGGGIGITYQDETPPDLADYAAIVREVFAGMDVDFMLEPGRSLVGNAGVLLTRTIFVKDGINRRFVIVDGAMNDLKRPAMYDARHEIKAVRAPAPGEEMQPFDVVGPVCETGDRFGERRMLPPVGAGDLLVLCSAGAYGAVMASTYNSRPLIGEVMVHGDAFSVIRPRQTYDEMLARDRMPDWLDEARASGQKRGAA